jgi:AraC-like DNA-binding protein/mannose-6-phosphate isomerase-like protein (cupin superfamily)
MTRVQVSSFLAPVTRRYSAGHVVPAHAHAWPQLLYASSGVMRVETGTGSWIVPPQRAVWLPPNSVHETRMLTDVHLASLYLRTEQWSFDCEVMEISPLLRELIVAALQIDPAHKPSRRESLITGLMVEELQAAPRGLSPIPLPVDQRLLALCKNAIANPEAGVSLAQLSADVGSTSKTISRLFQRELGISFRDWRQLVQVAYAQAHLIQGVPVKVVASSLGYTPSAFSVMMKRNAGRRRTRL